MPKSRPPPVSTEPAPAGSKPGGRHAALRVGLKPRREPKPRLDRRPGPSHPAGSPPPGTAAVASWFCAISIARILASGPHSPEMVFHAHPTRIPNAEWSVLGCRPGVVPVPHVFMATSRRAGTLAHRDRARHGVGLRVGGRRPVQRPARRRARPLTAGDISLERREYGRREDTWLRRRGVRRWGRNVSPDTDRMTSTDAATDARTGAGTDTDTEDSR